MKKPGISFDAIMHEQLQNDEFALHYLNEALSDQDPSLFLLAIRRIAEAKGISMTQLAKDAGVNRRGLYNILSERGNPEWTTLHTLMSALGFGLQATRRTA